MPYCDLVMKGGVTSGIVYPNAVLSMSAKYRFKNIGGTSAGAIAAAATAAAALGERRRELSGSGAIDCGFAVLRIVADRLQKEGFIYSLFQPAKHGRSVYRLLVKLTGRLRPVRASIAVVLGILQIAPLETIGSAAIFLLVGYGFDGWKGVAAATGASVLVGLLSGTIFAALRFGRVVRRNMLGLCTGLSPKCDQSGLTDWLHGVLQQLSGSKNGPLTFQDLWSAPRYEGEPHTAQTLRLQMITTSVSHQEPRSLPFFAGTFWFREDEFRKLFPADVVDWMIALDPGGTLAAGTKYHRLPGDGQLPVIVATRMSLSFPIVLSAVPLYEVASSIGDTLTTGDAAATEDEQPEQTPRRHSLLESTDALAALGHAREDKPKAFQRCWFSDGGISSNFPIHLFDAALPRWPTFAIDLTYPKNGKTSVEDVFLPTSNREGWQRQYSTFETRVGLFELAKFLSAIVSTMQNWRDLLLARSPGNRDRIVHVPLASEEGGMNLNMSETALKSVADKGKAAGDILAAKFNFTNHWWVRWRNVAGTTERFNVEVASAAGDQSYNQAPDALSAARHGMPEPPSYPLNGSQKKQSQRMLKRMIADGSDAPVGRNSLSSGAPRPEPQLRITPIY